MKVPSSLAIAAAFAASSTVDPKFYGINYDTRTSEWGGCKDSTAIDTDFAALNQLTGRIRIYGIDFNCTKLVLETAAYHGLKVWLGMSSEVGVDASFQSQMYALTKLVEARTINNDGVLGVEVSSEALHRYYVLGLGNTAGTSDHHGIDTVLGDLRTVRSYLRSQNLTFPVVITDTMDMYTKFPELYNEVDMVAVNHFSFWENKMAQEGAHFTFTRFQEHQFLAKRAGKLIELHATGWSSAERISSDQGVFTRDLRNLAARQNLNAYYFTAFDSTFGTNKIKRSFGIYDVNRNIKLNMRLRVEPLYPVRLWAAGGNVIKAYGYWNTDDSANKNPGRVYAAKPYIGPPGNLDDEIWQWDAENNRLYSTSSNMCLESFGNGTQTLRTSPCSTHNQNQKWNIVNKTIVSQNHAKFCIHVDVDHPPNDDGTLEVAIFPCNRLPHQEISLQGTSFEPLEIKIKAHRGILTETSGKLTWQTTHVKGRRNLGRQTWTYNPVTQLIASRSRNYENQHCLVAPRRINSARLVFKLCSSDVNQKWVVNDITGQIHHATHIGFCLDGHNNVDGLVYLAWCDKNNPNQQWSIKPLRDDMGGI
ncbi:hypothetical protein DYB34_014062 [Aphanomyces astaci]|uniref:glucan endo-1,3-beta-D-glucosidase n=1 Tax=Aphanomyces astaci TaxID=112090 RepID=A0A418BBB0_APHAT|nr:hypothetical protein DYB34_014062 [Aphanomyces astaci]